jgi:hypothetical protein
MINIDPGTNSTNRFVEAFDGHIDPGTKSSGTGEQNFHKTFPQNLDPLSDGSLLISSIHQPMDASPG